MAGDFIEPVLVAVLSYLLGSIPFGLLLTRAAGLGDVREIGSGNIGATNVLRTGRKGIAAATLALDAAKSVVPVLMVPFFAHERIDLLQLLAAAGALVGHCYPIWLGFRGGKGVATFFGIAFVLAWPIGLGSALIWLGLLAITRYSSVSGLGAANAAPLTALLIGRLDLAFFFLAISFLVDWKHRANIVRLATGTEPKVGRRRSA